LTRCPHGVLARMKSHKGTESKKGRPRMTVRVLLLPRSDKPLPAAAGVSSRTGRRILLAGASCGAEPAASGTTIDRVDFKEPRRVTPSMMSLFMLMTRRRVCRSRSASQARPDIRASRHHFKSVVSQIAEVSCKPDFWKKRHELAIAISRTSHKIDGPYQDVLTWARQLGDAVTFMERIDRSGSPVTTCELCQHVHFAPARRGRTAR